jgi:protein CpxP
LAVVVALLALNSATLVFIWLQRPPRAALDNRQARDPGEVLSRHLGFSQEQQQQFETLRTAHHDKMITYGDSLKGLKDSLFTLLLNRDSVHAGQLFSDIGILHQKVERVTFDHFQQVRSICTDEQRQKYDLMIKNAYLDVQRPSRDRALSERGQKGRAANDSLDRAVMPPSGEPGRPEPNKGPLRPPQEGMGQPEGLPGDGGQGQITMPPGAESGRTGPGQGPAGNSPNGQRPRRPRPGGPPPNGQRREGPPPGGGR